MTLNISINVKRIYSKVTFFFWCFQKLLLGMAACSNLKKQHLRYFGKQVSLTFQKIPSANGCLYWRKDVLLVQRIENDYLFCCSMFVGNRRFLIFNTHEQHTLRKQCPYQELFWPAFFLHFPAFGLNTETEYLSVFSPDAGKCGENANQNNSQQGHFLSVQMREYAGKMRTRITPNTDTFYPVIYDSKQIAHFKYQSQFIFL